MSLVTPLLLASLLVSPPASATLWEPGALIEDAAVIDVTDDGLDAVGGLIPALIPDRVDIPDTSDDGGAYEYSLSGAWAGITMTDAAIVPQNGMLTLDADLLVQLNDAYDPFDLYFEILWVISDSCDGHVQPFPAHISVDLALAVVPVGDGTHRLDATVGAMDVSYDLASEDIILENCSLGYLEQVLNFFGLSIYDLVIDYADSAIQDAIGDAAGDIEAMIEDAFASATINEQLDLNGVLVDMMLSPRDVQINPQGLRLLMQGSFATEQAAECIEAWDPGGSPMTDTEPPALGAAPSGIPADYHAVVLASDDMVNQALYALWRGGLLCYTIDENFESFPMSTSILGMLDGSDEDGPFDQLFPENAGMAIVTRPEGQPLANLSGDHDVDITVETLGLDFFADVDGRRAKVLGIDLAADIGADLVLDGSTGLLEVLLDLSPENIIPTVTSCELTAGAEPLVEANFGGLLQTILDAVVGDALSGLSFQLPSFEGLGLSSIDTAAAGTQADWLGLFANLGPVAYEGGCDDSGGGCGSSGCSGAGAVRAPWLLLALGAGLVARRRRREP
ncbi:MAG: hypothetical protein ABIO70_33485 [Pseudomonadota bacterium]